MFTLRSSSRTCRPRVSLPIGVAPQSALKSSNESHLSAENAFVLQAPFVVEWVDRCITAVTEDFKKIHPKVISFMLNLTSFLANNEWMIVRLRELDIVNR